MAHSTNDGRVTHNVTRRGPVGDPEFQAAAQATIDRIEQEQRPADGYDGLSKDDLAAACRDKGLPVTGNKPDLIARLRLADLADTNQPRRDDPDGGGAP
jgi:hypothetical protein